MLSNLDQAINTLRDDDNYYGEYGRQFLSNSDIDVLINDPKSFGQKREGKKVFDIGRLLHIMVCEPEKVDTIMVCNASTRASKDYKEMSKKHPGKTILLEKDMQDVSSYAGALKSNFSIFMDMNDEGNEFELPGIAEIGGVLWKGKTDIKANNLKKLIDVKTTGDISKFAKNARIYNYDSQAYIYSKIFGLPMEFYVVCKSTLKVGVFPCSERFMESGRYKVEKAVENYLKYFGPHASEDPEDHFIYQIL